jgi:RNA polymerase sigma factor (sigma-70 family)
VRLRLRSDDQLVALFRLGNEEAFRVIHDRYRARLLAYARQMLAASPAEAEDALQDVFLRAYGALRADDRPVTLRAWLYRVAHNRCIDQLRRPGTVELFDNVRSLTGVGADPIAEVERRDDLRQLVADVSQLPGQQRSALLMRELEGMSYNELAGALSVSVPAVKSLLVRARGGLTEAQLARETPCGDIRTDLITANDRGVRASGRSRRHLRDCKDCRTYRRSLKALQAGDTRLGALLGIGGSSAAAGGGAAASSGALFGGGVAAATATKVAAAVCCVAMFGGGAVEASRQLQQPATHARHSARQRTHAAVLAQAPVIATVSALTRQAATARKRALTVKPHQVGRRPLVPRIPDSAIVAPSQLATMTPQMIADDITGVPRTGGVLAPDVDDDATTTATTPPGESTAGSSSPSTGSSVSGSSTDAPSGSPGLAPQLPGDSGAASTAAQPAP